MTTDLFDAILNNRSLFQYAVPTVTSNYFNYSTEAKDNGVVLHIDVPGVKAEDVSVTLEDGNKIYIVAQRGAKKVVNNYWVVPKDYDPASASPRLDMGVLSITFSKSPEKQKKKFTVLT